MKSITVCDEFGNKYILEYTKNTIMRMEKAGFNLDEMDSKPLTQITLLYQGAFQANHPNTKVSTMDKIFGSLSNKEEFLKKLAEAYTEQAEALVAEGNATWEASW